MEKSKHIFTYDSGFIELNGISVGLSAQEFQNRLIDQGFTCDEGIFKGIVNGLGDCIVKVLGGNDEIWTVLITTRSRFTEEDMLSVFKKVNEDFPCDPRYDDHGYGVMPQPHEINHFWDFDQGHVTMQWEDNDKPISFWLRKPLIKDEQYWQSEVD